MSADQLFALVVFLLPVAAFSGWYFGRRAAVSQKANSSGSSVSSDYFRGLNYLLNDRPDKAIEVFIKVLEVESETVETHLALGSLFRRRGEVDRAIRVHQNLVARTTLDPEQRALGLLELGLDYMRSGLLDRAESLFGELLASDRYKEQAAEHLIDIYQQEQDWDKALSYTAQLEQSSGKNLGPVRAHFLCEQARAEITDRSFSVANELLDEARRIDKKCVRSSLMSAEIAMKAGSYGRAIERLKMIEDQDLAFLPEAIEPLVESYRALDRIDDLMAYLKRLSGLHVGITPVLALAELMTELGKSDEAKGRIIEELKIRPTVRGIDRLIDYSLHNAVGDVKENLTLLKELTAGLIEEKSSYMCGVCGFKGKSLHWQCPSCKLWNSVKPIHGIEGE